MQYSHIVIFITTTDTTEAEAIAQSLLEQRQVACVNIVPDVGSHFWWEGNIESAGESLLIAKTRENLLPEVIKTVETVHSYNNPEVIALPIIGGTREYLDWIDEEVA